MLFLLALFKETLSNPFRISFARRALPTIVVPAPAHFAIEVAIAVAEYPLIDVIPAFVIAAVSFAIIVALSV